MNKLELFFPLKPKYLVQGFGVENTIPEMIPKYASIGLKGHNGWDLVASSGQEVRATHDGTVTYAGLDGANGNILVLKTNDIFEYEGYEVYFKTLYGHLKSFNVLVGAQVKTGDLVAFADNTGMTTSDHLHFGLKPVVQGEQEWVWFNLEQDNGYNGAIDPAPYFNGFYAVDSQRVREKANALIRLLEMLLNFLKGRQIK